VTVAFKRRPAPPARQRIRNGKDFAPRAKAGFAGKIATVIDRRYIN
jgi:hypothetical protein